MESEKKAPSANQSSSSNKLRNLAIVGAVALAGYYFVLGGKDRWPFGAPVPEAQEAAATAPESGPPTLELTEKQIQTIKIGKISSRDFRIVKAAVGNVDFNQDQSTQVSSPYQGRILEVMVYLGDRVTRGQPLFTLQSTDLMTAGSTLIQTAGVLDLTNANLVRLRGAARIGGAAQKDLDQAISDQKTAEGNYRAARLAMVVFGRTEEEIDQVVRERKVDQALLIRSPVDGIVSSRVAAPGFLVQPGIAPTPITVSDDKTMWLNSYVIESDALAMRPGQQVVAKVAAAEEESFIGKVTRVGGAVDPNTHRLLVRSVIDDPDHKLRANMIATFEITTEKPAHSLSIPATGVVRQGDGTMTAWVQKDATHFTQRVVKLGILQDGYDQVLEGLQEGEPVILEGAVFVDNILNAPPSD
jgi:cobalt-zinc-cadmium efflux system membrane fusion protein